MSKENSWKGNMNFETKSVEGNLYIQKRIWDTPMSEHNCNENEDEPHYILPESMRKVIGIQEIIGQLFCEMKIEFGEELRNPHKPLRTNFDWPATDKLSKVDCLRVFNIMKQILLQEMSRCDFMSTPHSFVLRKKFYLERRFQSLEKEKIRRLKIYESIYPRDEVKSGL